MAAGSRTRTEKAAKFRMPARRKRSGTSPKKRSGKRPAKRSGTRSAQTAWYVTALRALAVLAAVGALAVFVYWAGRLTLTPVHDRGQALGNTRPGHTLRFYLDRPSVRDAAAQIGGNLVLLAPLGILLPVLITRLRNVVMVTIAGALVSLAIELAQGSLIAGRAFDADDVILNTAGVGLTYLIVGRRIARLVRGAR
jgi:hypothetical protein